MGRRMKESSLRMKNGKYGEENTIARTKKRELAKN